MKKLFLSKTYFYTLVSSILVCTMLLGFVSHKSIKELSVGFDNLYNNALQGSHYISEIGIATQKARAVLLFIANNTNIDKAVTEQKISDILKIGETTTENYKLYEQTIASDENRQNFEELKRIRSKYLELRDQIIELIRGDKYDKAKVLVAAEESVLDEYYLLAIKILHYNQHMALEYNKKAQEKINIANFIIGVVFVISTIIILFALVAINNIFTKLKEQRLKLKVSFDRLEQNHIELGQANSSLMEQARELEELNEELDAGKTQLEAILKEQDDIIVQETNKRLEAERILAQQAKLISMREMMGNVAHQWRQPLNALALNIQDILLEYEMGELDKEYITKFKADAMQNVNTLSKTIDSFREMIQPDDESKEFSVQDAVIWAADIIKGSLESLSAHIEISKPDEPIFRIGHKNELVQAIVSILNNCKDVIAEKNPQDKTISVNVENNFEKAKITIIDRAGGIQTDIMDKIFEPYYTTKHQAIGVGLSLYIAKTTIEKKMNGSIRAYNTQDGACFEIEI